MHQDVERLLITKEEIAKRVDELAAEITHDYKGESVLMICILRGAVMFFADLSRKIDLDVRLDFMSVSSYGSGTKSSGEVRIIKDIAQPIEGLNVIIVEDIIDSGYTLRYLKNLLSTRSPKSVKICSLLDKPSRRVVDLYGDYVGFTIPNEFAVGYGLDYNDRYRNLEDIGVLKREIYEK